MQGELIVAFAHRERLGTCRYGDGMPDLSPQMRPVPTHSHHQRLLGGLHCDRLLSRLRTDALGLCLLLCRPLLPMPIEQQTDLLCTDVGPTEPLQGSTRCAIRPRTAC